MTTKFNIQIAGENALIIYFADPLDDHKQLNSHTISIKIQHAQQLIYASLGKNIIDLIPSYSSILVVFDMFTVSYPQFKAQLEVLLATKVASLANEKINQQKMNTINLPVYYSMESGPDLAKVAHHANITTEQVIEIHQSVSYQVFTIGFAPGFAYLGNVNEKITTPRLTTPRHKVFKGSVGIADNQTAVYPSDSPGGWNIIGNCPIAMFAPEASPSMPVKVGDRVKFYRISKEEFLALGGVVGYIGGIS